MDTIRYCGITNKWWSTDGYHVKFFLRVPGWELRGIPDQCNSVDISVRGDDYIVTFEHLTGEFRITKDVFDVRTNITEFSIVRGHPVYEFFKKRMNRNGVVFLKPLDTREDWQSY